MLWFARDRKPNKSMMVFAMSQYSSSECQKFEAKGEYDTIAEIGEEK